MGTLVATVYVPAWIFAMGQAAVIPTVALAAKDLGASVAVAGATAALRGIGVLLADIPAGRFVARAGERSAMLIATAVLSVALLGCIVAPNVWVFAACMLAMGCAWSVWMLARLTYIAEAVPARQRGRVLSSLGGVQRMGTFVGPLAGAVAIGWMGIDGAYVVHLVLALVGCAVIYFLPDPPGGTVPDGSHQAVAVRRLLVEHRDVFRSHGVVALCISLMRSTRDVVLPLWGSAIGLNASQISLIFGLASALDMTCFYPVGIMSDRWGRRAVAVPCLALFALGLGLVPFTDSFTTLLGAALVAALANGFGSGIVLTLGSDLAPVAARAEFLGVWRLVSDLGTSGGPLLVSGIEAAATLSTAVGAVTAMGMGGVWVASRMTETLRHSVGP